MGTNMLEGCDDGYDAGLEDILAEEQDDTDFEHADAWREEIDLGIAEVKGDLYFIHADAYLEEIEMSMDEFRPEIDDHHDWQDEVDLAIDRAQQD